MEIKRAERKGLKPFYPIIGFFTIIVVGILSFFLARPTLQLARRIFPDMRGYLGFETEQLTLMFGFVVFIVLLTVIGGIVAVFAKRPKNVVREGDMAKERQEMLKAKTRAKVRQRKMNQRAREQIQKK